MASTQYTLLVVDDEQVIRSLLREILQDPTVRVVEAKNGVDALEIIKNEMLDLIITDMVMPEKSGYQLLVELKNLKIETPVVVITGEPMVEAAVECIRLGAVDYITKPFDLATIEKQVKKLLVASTANRKRKLIADSPSAPEDDKQKLEDYQILKIIGEGSMGVVFLAQKDDDDSGQNYALKILKNNDFSESNKKLCRERFINEANAAASVKHKNVVKIIEFGISSRDEIPYIVMEFISGKSLKHLIKNADFLSFTRKAYIIRQVAESLVAIHSCGICHRDIKPDNILVDSDHKVTVTDFGIAKLPGSDLTMSTDIMGTPAYLSPEAFVSAKVDFRSDIFSLGSVAYELFVGRRPFAAGNLLGFCQLIRRKEPTDPRIIRPDFPEELQVILARMMKKDPQKRYDSAQDIIDVLDTYITTASGACRDARSESVPAY